MDSVGRNQPCPCGSGRRFKDCHGALGTSPSTDAAASPRDLSWVPEVMQVALRAQRAGRPREAAEGYRRVLAADPQNIDALHMLGLTEYEDGREHNALALLRRAIELKPDFNRARKNLQLLEQLPQIEEEIGRDVLPRLLARIEPVVDVSLFAATAAHVHIVVADDREEVVKPVLDRLTRAIASAPRTLWVDSALSLAIPGARVLDPGAGARPEGGLLVLCGAVRSPAAWLGAARPERVLLVVLAEAPGAVIDRIDEIAALSGTRPGLACASRALAERLRLPLDAVVPEGEPMAAVRT
ncbi:MAG TPA: SEC-C metal-binding domain-containing protein [Casimicrobiaceae bacterium]